MKDQFLLTVDHPVLHSHVVHGQHMMPGLAYIDLVYQALRNEGHAFEQWELRDLWIYEPLVVNAQAPKVLTVEATRATDDKITIAIHSEDHGGHSLAHGRCRHVIVQAIRSGAAAYSERIDLESIKRTAHVMTLAKVYDRYRDLGLAHGAFMRANGDVYITQDAVYVQASVGPEALASAAAVIFSPALLDGSAACGSVGLAYANAAVSKRMSLPLRFESFRATAMLREDCIARLSVASARQRKELSYVSVDFFDRQGRKVAELRDLAGTSGMESSTPVSREDRAPTLATDSSEGELTDHVERTLLGWFADSGHPVARDVESTTSFAEMGVDSAALLQLLRQIEQRLGEPLSPTLLFEYSNIKELAGYLAQTHRERFTVDESDRAASVPAAPSFSQPLMAEEGGSVADRIERVLLEWLATNGPPALRGADPTTSFAEMGIDSAGLLQLLKDIEARLGEPLSPTLLFEYSTIRELAVYLASAHADRFAASTESVSGASQDASRVEVQAPLASQTVEALAEGSSPQLSSPAGDEIAIIGISGRFPGAATVEELWDVLKSGTDCITEIPRERWDFRSFQDYEDYCRWEGLEFCHHGGFIADVDKFDAEFFGLQGHHPQCMDPQLRLFLQTTWQLLESGGYTRQRLREEHKRQVGVYVGAMYYDYSHIASDISQELGSYLSFHSSIANRVSHFLDLVGPSHSIDSLCSSSAVAIHTACRDLRSGECEVAIVGGVNLSLHHKKFLALSHQKYIGSHEGSRSFADGNGYLPAEAVVAVLLKPLSQAVAARDRILGVIKSTAVNHSGRSNGYTVPNPTAQAQAMQACLARAKVDARTVSYVEATSNGSPVGDPMELLALHRVFARCDPARDSCPVGTVKSNIGHAEGASALTQIAKVLLQFQHRQLPPSIKVESLNPLALWTDTIHLLHERQEWRRPIVAIDGRPTEIPRRALLNSFAAGGTNACLLLEEFIEPATVEKPAASRPEIIIFSARNAERLSVMLHQALEYLQSHRQLSLTDIAYTLQIGREAMRARVAIVASSTDELLSLLRQSLALMVPENVPVYFGGEADRADASARPTKAAIDMLISKNDANRLAQLWAQGVRIHWRALHANGSARTVPLPVYPFALESHWLPARQVENALAPLPESLSEVVSTSTKWNTQWSSSASDVEHEYVAPRNNIEKVVGCIWEEVLEIPQIGVHDSFFELGGNSLAVGMVIARCADAFNVEIDWGIMLGGDPTVAGFAQTIVEKLAQGMSEVDLEAVLADA